ncbi:superoxide dismutase family protein [Cellulomonas bogoriensis]|uniref:Superoxide dismutase [Cu-Zn] n=1 Tax=Cellulomonas bogoriensis 69B4 = DSM 16987 TaxID=1386082 RepID=A0A0A0BR72_9CELL|nr:superoxide dismutase family protein [Cellulomonas bogoriensis]KGM09599.1 superoxide dismutase [Cellulomonas bogoriensis 69B4 = DSM 16987]
MRRTTRALLVPAAATVLLVGCTADDVEDPPGGLPAEDATTEDGAAGMDTEPGATAVLRTPEGEEIGTVWLTDTGTGTEVRVQANGLEPGFRGFHIHGIGECEPDSPAPDDPDDVGDFLSAGGHLDLDGSDHGAHAGDLPPLLVTGQGTADLTILTDLFTIEDLLDEDGAAFMVHGERDNFAHIPERYAPDGPDEDTLATGDAGPRIACGVVTP